MAQSPSHRPSNPDPSHATAVKAANLIPRPVWISTPYIARCPLAVDLFLRPKFCRLLAATVVWTGSGLWVRVPW
jgi:hypothetical protein